MTGRWGRRGYWVLSVMRWILLRMRMGADGDEEGRGDDYDAEYDAEYDQAWSLDDGRAYWRRRFFILCGGVVALGVCAWLFPGARQPSAHEVAATRASMAALARQQALPPAASGPAWPRPNESTSPTVAAKPASAISPKKKTTAKPSANYRPSAVPAPGVAPCAPADIVLSLFTSRPSYAKGARPSFSVYAVSMSVAACSLMYGAGSVQVVVTRHGQVVWDSAACRSAAVKAVRFTPGVPQVLTLVWNPEVTQPTGCAGSLPSDSSGTLDAVALSHGQSSPVRAFTLDR